MGDNTSSTPGYLTPTSIPPEDDDVLAGIMHDFAVGLTGLDPTLVRPRWQPQPPTMPAASVNWAAIGITSYEPIGYWPEMIHNDGNSVQRQHQIMEATATFYGPNSTSIASMFLDGLTVRQNLEVLGTFGIKLRHPGRISRVPELINTQYIPRSDVTFWLVREMDRTYNIANVASSEVTLINDTGYTTVADVNP